VQKKGSDAGIFALFFAQLVSEKKSLSMPADARAKLSHKFIELMQSIKPIDGAVLKELSALADSSPAVEVVEEQDDGKKKKRRTLQLGPVQLTDDKQKGNN